MTEKFYITTAIDYVNARPHIGHAFEKVLADAIARWERLNGKDVFFLTGVDENAQKNVEAAQKAGISVKKFVDTNTGFFIELCKKLDISYDDFIRTSAEEHAKVVQKIVKKLEKKGDVYKATYKGLYCIGCEAYLTEKDLVNGKCPEHNKEPELREEEAYFFKLSKYKKELIKIIPNYVIPKSKQTEVISRINEELKDICISRKGAKLGVDFPDDKEFKIWVWVDALINYISGLKNKESKYWPADVHVIGKGINWFHSIIWPALLISADYKIPKTLLVHGYLNVRGQKISKSLGNTIDPLELLKKYPSDVIRYSLLRNSIFEDSDYSELQLIERNNNELANKLGNLISRTTTLAEKYEIEKTQNNLLKKLNLNKIEKDFDSYELDKALSDIFAFVDICNEYIQSKKPWESKDKKVLYELIDSIKAIAILLSPFLPETSEKISKQLGFKIDYKEINKQIEVKKIKKAEVLFKKIELPKEKKETNKNNKIKKPEKQIEGIMTTIDFKEWEKIDLRVGKIISAEDIKDADKLYKLEVDLGDEKRTICAGIKGYYSKSELKGKHIIVFTNLAPRQIKGIESKGMLLAAVNSNHSKVILISPEKDVELGSRVS
ncbi:MAG: methionine--tRNA ligase [Candidatus Pacearchaeota archaeon]